MRYAYTSEGRVNKHHLKLGRTNCFVYTIFYII